ncbi:RNA-directed DNA polymerase [bacterium]|nr:RNA-directed DNA polymerase [bacterium]
MRTGLKLDSDTQKSFWEHLRYKSIPQIASAEQYTQRKEILVELEQEVEQGRYSPGALYATLSFPKASGVARFVPVFTPRDYAVFFGCVKAIDEQLSGFRQPNTFGGWTLSGTYKGEEEQQVQELTEELNYDEEDYIYGSISSFNKYAWLKYWNQYWKVTHAITGQLGDYSCIAFDVANFYDSVELPRLERYLRRTCTEHPIVIEILMFFLAYWNREINKYAPSSKGVPQDIVGDCSRILANFYLYEYDKDMTKYCHANSLHYLRWSDDMMVIGKAGENLENCVFAASDRLYEIGLNINTGKVKQYTKAEFESYWRFDLLVKLSCVESVEDGLRELRKIHNCEGFGRSHTALKLALNKIKEFNLSRYWQNWISDVLLASSTSILTLTNTQMSKIVSFSSDPLSALTMIGDVICSRLHTVPHLQYIRFLRKLAKVNKSLPLKWGLPYIERINWNRNPAIATELSGWII